MSRNIARFFHFSLQIEFNALRFINYTIPRLCSTYVDATLDDISFATNFRTRNNQYNYRNTNEKSGTGFSVFSVFQAECRFEGKNPKNCLSSVAHKNLTEKVYDSHHRLSFILRG